MKFSLSNIPMIEVEIQNNKYLLDFDLGSKSQLTLKKELLEGMKKKPMGKSQFKDFKGRNYEAPSYKLAKVNIGRFSWKEIIVREVDDTYSSNATIWVKDKNLPERRDGEIGRPILEKTNLLLDFTSNSILLCNSIKKLQKSGYNLQEYVKIPFQFEGRAIVITCETEIGPLKLSIDTGATVNGIRPIKLAGKDAKRDWRGLPYYQTSKSVIGDHDFGPLDLFLIDITPELHEFDGVLGMAFMKKHIIYIDYPNKYLYLNFEKLPRKL